MNGGCAFKVPLRGTLWVPTRKEINVLQELVSSNFAINSRIYYLKSSCKLQSLNKHIKLGKRQGKNILYTIEYIRILIKEIRL